jgi:hypothetical protein
MRDDVAIWRAGGLSQETIAKAIGIEVETLLKHFAEEMNTGWAKKVAAVVKARYKSATGGNVSAQTKFLEDARAVGAEQALSAPADDRKPRVQPVGKKEAATEAAKSAGAGTDWGNDLLPSATIQ